MDVLATVTYAGTKKNLVESEMVADTPAIAAPQKEGDPWRVKVVLLFGLETSHGITAELYQCFRVSRCASDTS